MMSSISYKISKVCVVLLFFVFQGFGQAINTLSIIPANPIPEDSVKVIANVWLPSGDCWLQTTGISVIGQDVNVYAGYDAGMLTVICTSIDTVTLGRFDVGTYNCNFNLIYPYFTSAIDDIETISFNVGSPASIDKVNNNEAILFLIDGPNGGYTLDYSLPANDVAQQIMVFDVLGRLLYSNSLPPKQKGTHSIAIPTTGGSILITIKGKSGRTYNRLFF